MRERLKTPWAAYGLSFFRAIFGLILFGSVVRFWLKGWIEAIYIEPVYHFPYPFFEWIAPPSDPTFVYATFASLALLAIAITLGLYPRLASALFCLLFTWVELWDRATYLNHYYFVSLMTFLLAMIPTAGYFSVKSDQDQRWVEKRLYLAIRILVGLVYFYAGIAKINSDWLFHGEPLLTWLHPFKRIFTLNGLIPLPLVAIGMSWGGMIFDTTVPFFLSWRKTRPFAFMVAVVFHTIVGLLFPIGVFPFVMVGAVTIFFEPTWPKDFVQLVKAKLKLITEPSSKQVCHSNVIATFTGGSFGCKIVLVFLTLQLLIPLRSFAYPGFQNWNDDGFAFSWRVMLVERWASTVFVVYYNDGRKLRYYPRDELTKQQYKIMTQSPDMMVRYAKDLKYKLNYLPDRDQITRISVESYVAFNGRRLRQWLDPQANLLNVGRLDFQADFVLPFVE